MRSRIPREVPDDPCVRPGLAAGADGDVRHHLRPQPQRRSRGPAARADTGRAGARGPGAGRHTGRAQGRRHDPRRGRGDGVPGDAPRRATGHRVPPGRQALRHLRHVHERPDAEGRAVPVEPHGPDHPHRPARRRVAGLRDHGTAEPCRGGRQGMPLTPLRRPVVAGCGRAAIVWLGLAIIAAAEHPLGAGGLVAVSIAAAIWLVGLRIASASAPYALGPWVPAHLRQRPGRRPSKRLFDVLLAVSGLAATVLLLPLLVLLVKWTPGPLIYRQTRVGERGRRFTMYKLRTMPADAERPGEPVFAQAHDPRASAAGRFLRRTHLDELPQLWNVLKGDMSIVGPRPERPEFVEMLEASIPYWSRRLLMKPGMTGWAQVRCGYASDCASAAEKLSYDFWYMRHGSLAVDLAVCVKTVLQAVECLEPRRLRMRGAATRTGEPSAR